MIRNALLSIVLFIAAVLSFLDFVLSNKVPPTTRNMHLAAGMMMMSLFGGFFLGHFFFFSITK